MATKRIGVLGLLPAQAHAIENVYRGKAKFKFWDGGDPIDSLKAISRNSDAIFMRTKHCSHATQTLLKQYGADFTLVNGGLNQLQTAIGEFLNGR